MLPLRLSNEPSYCLIYHKNSIDINRNGKIYHFTWRWLFFENTIVNITFEIVKRSIFWSDIPYEWYRLINKKSKIYHFIWQRLFDRKAIVNITFEIVKWAIGQLEFLEWGKVRKKKISWNSSVASASHYKEDICRICCPRKSSPQNTTHWLTGLKQWILYTGRPPLSQFPIT